MFWERFYNLCVKNGIKPNPFADEVGISSGLITKWKKGATPNTDALIKISDYFEVSIDYLLGREQKFTSSELTDKEQEILNLFKNNLSESQRDMVLERARTISEMNAPNITLEQTVPIKAVAYGAANTDTKMTVEQQQSVERRIKKLKNKTK